MGKRASVASNTIEPKPRRKGDWYPTPRKAVEPLIKHLLEYGTFIEPCAGDGALIEHIESLTDVGMHCMGAYDVEPKLSSYLREITQRNALSLAYKDVLGADFLITNPPFQWGMLQPLLDHLPSLRQTWLLLPFGYACNKRMAPYMNVCRKVQPIGRVKWIEDSKQSSTDDFAWFLFDNYFTGTTKLYPRD